MLGKQLDYSVEISPKAQGNSSLENLRKKVLIKLVLPEVIKATILYMPIALASNQLQSTVWVFVYLISSCVW
jgi:hypothetical protein